MKLAGRKIDSDAKLMKKVMEYIQRMAAVKAYHLSSEKSRKLNEAIAANVRINADMEMLLIPHMSAQKFISKLTGEEMYPEDLKLEALNIDFSYDSRKIIDGVSLSIPEKPRW